MLPLALLLGFLMILIAFGLQSQSREQLRMSIQRVRGQQARGAADAGLTTALQQLASNADYQGQTQPVTVGEGPESYTVRILRSPTAMPDGQTLPEGCIYVLSKGQASQSVVQIGALVKVGTSGSKGLPGAFGASIEMSNGSRLDSYDSRKGGYKVVNQNATMVTNSESPGSIYLKGGSKVLGSIAVGPKGVIEDDGSDDNESKKDKQDKKDKKDKTSGSSTTIWIDNGASFGSSSLQETPKVLPPVELPSKPGSSDVTIDWKVTDLPPGNYDKVKVSNGASLVLKPGVYVIRTIELSGGARVTLASSDTPVKMYITEKFDLNNGVNISSPSNRPDLFQLNLADGAKYEQSGGTNLTGIVYGPGASIKMENSADVYGAVVGSSITMSGSGSIHYDEALADYALSGGASSSGSTSGVQVLFRQRW